MVHILQWKAQEHCRKGIPNEVCLLELEWYMREIIVTYIQCKRYRKKRYHIEKNRGQGVIKDRQK